MSVMEEERVTDASTTDKRIDDLSGRVGRFEDRFERFEDRVEARFDKVDERFEKVDRRFAQVATREELAKIDARLDSWGKTITVGVRTIVVAVVGALILKLIGV